MRAEVEGYNDTGTSKTTITRRFERDKETLRTLGVNVVYTCDPERGVWGYMVPGPSRRVRDIALSESEVHLLAALAVFGGRGSGPLHESLASACQKMLAQSAFRQTEHPGRGKHVVHIDAAAADAAYAANLEVLAEAIERRARLIFTYYSISRDRQGRRLVEPYGLKYWKGSWYLVGLACDSDAVRVFRVDRIKGNVRFEETDGRAQYEIPPDFSIDDYVGRSPWELSRKKAARAVIELDDIGAWLLKEASPSGVRVNRSRGKVVAKMQVRNEQGFYRWLFGLGTHAKILEPKFLVDGYLAFLSTVRDSWEK
jgi:predicted DNA-binding transcriptional regulator YafY